jgi:hypothetical protein
MGISKIEVVTPGVQQAKKRSKKKGSKKNVERRDTERGRELAIANAGQRFTSRIPDLKRPVIVDRVDRDKILRFLSTAMYPCGEVSRIPAPGAIGTALYRSKRAFTIPVVINTSSSDSGKFSIAVQPKVGNLDSPLSFQIAISDPSTMANSMSTTNWLDSTKYVSFDTGDDPRVDRNIETLCLSSVGYYVGTGVSGMTAAIPFGTGGVTSTSQSYNLTVNYVGNSASDFFIPTGTYLAYFRFTGTGLSNITVGGTVTSSTVAVTANSAATNLTGMFEITVGGSSTNDLNVTVTGTTVASASLRLVPVVFGNTTLNVDSGIASSLRPVGQSVLATYIADEFSGGRIAAGLVTADGLTQDYFSTSFISGNFHDWDKLATLPRAYDGKIKRGAYVWWRPDDKLDYSLRKPSEINSRVFPSIVISGVYQPQNPVNGTYNVLRLEVCTVFEYTSDSTFPEQDRVYGSEADLDFALDYLAVQPFAMANDDHVPWYRRAISWIVNAYRTGKATYEELDALSKKLTGQSLGSNAAMLAALI